MPRSVVIYTNPEVYLDLSARASQRYASSPVKPYTLSPAQPIESGQVRVRVTELVPDALSLEIGELVGEGRALLASSADRDVRSATYEELIEDGDRYATTAILQFVTPVLVRMAGRTVPFPVTSALFEGALETWNAFSPKAIERGVEGLDHVRVSDFRISCVATAHGPGAQGWVAVEMEQGRTEEEIGLFNGLLDFLFFAGTGLNTCEGLGQTRRMEPERQRGRGPAPR
jgi:hypothetical protein